jgi:hypothetical protein
VRYILDEIMGEVIATEDEVVTTPSPGWELKRSWEIDEDTRIFEWRSDRNHLSVECHVKGEADSREKVGEAITCLVTAFTILNCPEGGNY